MAALDRLVSNNALANLFGSEHRRKLGFHGSRRGSGNMGLSATNDFSCGHGPSSTSVKKREDEQILTELIKPYMADEAEKISSELIDKFGSLPRVLAAFEDGFEAARLPESVKEHLWTLRRLISRVLRLDISDNPILSSTDALIAYLHNEMAHLSRETLRVLFLDVNNRLVHEQVMWVGTLSSVQIHPREVIRVALERNASALILVHNHPSGNPSPSGQDIAVTRELCAAAQGLDIVVHDHIILSHSGHISMRAEGLMN